MLRVDLQKKGHGRLIADAALVLPLGLGKFGHVLGVDFQQKKWSTPVDRCGNGTFALHFG